MVPFSRGQVGTAHDDIPVIGIIPLAGDLVTGLIPERYKGAAQTSFLTPCFHLDLYLRRGSLETEPAVVVRTGIPAGAPVHIRGSAYGCKTCIRGTPTVNIGYQSRAGQEIIVPDIRDHGIRIFAAVRIRIIIYNRIGSYPGQRRIVIVPRNPVSGKQSACRGSDHCHTGITNVIHGIQAGSGNRGQWIYRSGYLGRIGTTIGIGVGVIKIIIAVRKGIE